MTLNRVGRRTQELIVRPSSPTPTFSHTQNGALDTGHTPGGSPAWQMPASPVPSPFLSGELGEAHSTWPLAGLTRGLN